MAQDTDISKAIALAEINTPVILRQLIMGYVLSGKNRAESLQDAARRTRDLLYLITKAVGDVE